MKISFLAKLSLLATLLALTVVLLGAYTRLSDAGLGCPDWPGCYGHAIVPTATKTIALLQPAKAWKEMIHRYAAGTLGVLVLFFAVIALRRRQSQEYPLLLPLALLGVVVFQALLGMWTVTLKLLPVVVMGHLLGGMSILALLWLLHLQLGHYFSAVNVVKDKRLRVYAGLGLALVIIQIGLGGWVSSNYAALICPHFPFCRGSLFPQMNFSGAFNLFSPLGNSYEGGRLDEVARITIQMCHRYGAMIVGSYLGIFATYLSLAANERKLKLIGFVMLILLATQISLGILNIEWFLAMPIAVLHNGVAAILLLSLVTLNFVLFSPTRSYQ